AASGRARPAGRGPRRRRYTAAWARWRSCGSLRNLNDGEEQPELANGVGEAFVVHRLGDVDVAAEFIAALDLMQIVGRREHDDRRAFQIVVFLDPSQDVDAG